MALSVAIPWWLALLTVLVLAAIVVWASRRDTDVRASEDRASLAEARAATAEAVVTMQAQSQAATATALAQETSPETAVSRSLDLLLAADREPTPEHLRALGDVFAPAALAVVRPEVEHLISGGLHLAPSSGYELTILASGAPGPDEAEVRTHEQWTYDERTGADQPSRCLIEISDQTYGLRRLGSNWQVVDIQLAASTRKDC